MSSLYTDKKCDGKLYIGKTEDFNSCQCRHFNEGMPVFMQLAIGTPEQISELEDYLIKWNQTSNSKHCQNQNQGSGGNVLADKLYACMNSSLPTDELNEYDEKIMLGQEFPIKIKE